MNEDVVLAVHGGAGWLNAERTSYPGRGAYDAAVARACRAGQRVLLDGGAAVDAVVAAVSVLEDEPLFNAGRGAALCRDGNVELSASIMDGCDRRVGAMVGLRRVRNPIRAAHALLPDAHGMLFGAAAEAFALARGLASEPTEYFLTPMRVEQLERHRGSTDVALDHSDDGQHGTVGAVARDRDGRLAAATSTGGLVNQLPGRVGDTPIVGAGTWADERCAISATGDGDAFLRVAFARRVADLAELSGGDFAASADRALREVAAVGGSGGCIAVTADGRLWAPFHTEHMVRGMVWGASLPTVAIQTGDDVEVSE